MRRGRPTSSTEHAAHRPSPSPMRITGSDPFAALDAAPTQVPDAALFDEASARFPALDQFSILHDSGSKFAFDPKPPSATPVVKDISQRVTEALADDAFALPAKATMEPLTHSKSVPSNAKPVTTRQPLPATSRPLSVQQPLPQQNIPLRQTAPQPPKMVSTGTMTSPEPPETKIAARPIFRFPPETHERSTSQSRIPDKPRFLDPKEDRGHLLPQRPALADHRSKSQTPTLTTGRFTASPRLSAEIERPVAVDYEESLSRSRSVNIRNRPVSAHVDPSHQLVFPESRSRSRGSPRLDAQRIGTRDIDGPAPQLSDSSSDDGREPAKIESNVDFLKAMEEEDPNKRKEKRNSTGLKHSKRSSLSSISLSGTKSLLAGRFGEAFRRFETNTSGPRDSSPPPDHRNSELTPIAGSEATDGRSDDGHVLEETDATPEVRRELERRRLSQEERRVAEAAAAYKARVAENGPDAGKGRRDGNRATLIQNKVQALLDENGKSPTTKTAEGYGKYTDSVPRTSHPATMSGALPSTSADLPINRQPDITMGTSSAPPVLRPYNRPSAPPKPPNLRTGSRGEPSPALSTQPNSGSRLSQQLDGKADSGDWEANFSKRYPNLSGIEMVETMIDKDGSVITTKDV
jgi:AP2-associated kinase